MVKRCFFIVMIILGASCTNETQFIDLANVNQTRENWVANGSDTLSFVIVFNNESVIDQIVATASITNGKFVDSDSQELSFTPKRTPKNKIESTIVVQSSTTNSDSKVTFNINEFEDEFEIMSAPSLPAKISLSASSFSVESDFGNEIEISGRLSNSDNKMVSTGVKVEIEDFLENGDKINGVFRDQSLASNANSEISTKYTVGNLTPDQNIILVATVLDENNERTQIKDTVTVYVKPKS